MLIVLSPAKDLDFTPPQGPAAAGLTATAPRFPADTAALLEVLGGVSADALAELMDLSPRLAELNVDRYAALRAEPGATEQLPALYAFNGEVYRGLEARTLGATGVAHASRHLRILSGLYGLLRPSDLIAPHRLEMGTRLATPRGRDLYQFWGDRIANALAADARETGAAVIVNLASQEYFPAARAEATGLKVLSIHFREAKGGQSRVIGTFAKRARGRMARYAIDQRLTEPDGLRGFALDGYAFAATHSTASDWVFERAQPAPKRG